jgi:hypothetical protein
MWGAAAVDLAYKNWMLLNWAGGGLRTAVRIEHVQLASVDWIGIGEHTWIDWRSVVYGAPLRLVQQ